MSEEGRGGSQSVNPNSLQETAKGMLLAAKGETPNCSSVGSDECPVRRGSVSQAPSLSSSSSPSSGRVVEPPAFEGGNLSNDTSYKHADDDEVTFKRIVIVKTTTLNMMKGKNHK